MIIIRGFHESTFITDKRIYYDTDGALKMASESIHVVKLQTGDLYSDTSSVITDAANQMMKNDLTQYSENKGFPNA